MGCRCNDIIDYRDDIRKLVSVESYTETLLGLTNDVRSNLDETKSEYDSTIEATGEFLGEFARLDDGANANALSIKAQVQGAKMTLEQKLREAEDEDRQHHAQEDLKARKLLL